MGDVLVMGLINIETTLRVERFPIDYTPVRYLFGGIQSTVAGVGYNVTKALTTLGTRARFLSLVGRDLGGAQALAQLRADGLPADYVLAELDEAACSVILYDGQGRRQVNVDLKDVQQRAYPAVVFEQAAEDADLAVLCNINFSRPFLEPMQARGVPIATDVHAISSLDDDFNQDFMRAASILFLSDENLPCSPEDWVRAVWDRFGTPIVVVGLGAQGALLGVRDDDLLTRLPAVTTRPIVSTIGAGDALLSCFVHVYLETDDPYTALERAMIFASYKLGAASSSDGFLSAAELERLAAGLATE